MSDIFISYSNEDKPKVKHLAELFEELGLSVWWDKNIKIGGVFDDIIEEEINNARCILVVWTKYSVKSKWVRSEAQAGIDRDIYFPVNLEEVKIPIAFSRYRTVDLNNWDETKDAPEFIELVSNVKNIIEAGSKQPPPPKVINVPGSNGNRSPSKEGELIARKINSKILLVALIISLGVNFIMAFYFFITPNSEKDKEQIMQIMQANTSFANYHYDKLEKDFNVFVDKIYKPYQVRMLVEADILDMQNGLDDTLTGALVKATKNPDSLKTAQEYMTIFIVLLQEDIEDYRSSLLSPLQNQRKNTLNQISHGVTKNIEDQIILESSKFSKILEDANKIDIESDDAIISFRIVLDRMNEASLTGSK